MSEQETKPVILMVDDEAEFIDIVRRWAEADYQFVGLTDGGELEEEIDGLEPSLIVLDVNMPGIGGFELCREIRAQRRYDDIPVLFLTGSREDEDFLKNLEAGGTAYLSKPVGRKQLLGMFRELIGGEVQTADTGGAD
ncbi:MAG: PleD family two-component system response regulator [Elusimicrobiota bacterium]